MHRGMSFALATGLLPTASIWAGLAAQSPELMRRTVVLSADPASNSATGILHLRDTSGRSRIHLTAGEFRSVSTGKGVNAPVSFFAPDSQKGTPVLRLDLPAGEVVPVRVEVTNLWEAGESEDTLYADGSPLGTLRVLKYRVPFNVKLVAPNPDQPELTFTRGRKAHLSLKNDDGMTYVVRPVFAVAGHRFNAPTVVLPPNGGETLELDPPDAWFGLAGLLKPVQRDGQLTLRFEAPGTTSDPGWPGKVIPFKAGLSVVGPGLQKFLAFLLVLFLLALGGAASLLLRHWVPNSLGRARLRERLDELGEQTRLLPLRTSSTIRVGLRVERQRLAQQVQRGKTYSPELPNKLAQLNQRTDEIQRQVRLVEQLNELRDRLDQAYREGVAPSRVARIEDEARAISTTLSKVPLSLAELESVEKRIAAATALTAALATADPEWLAGLQASFDGLTLARATLEADYAPCQALFASWAAGWTAVDPKQYDRLDKVISILQLIRDDLDQLKSSTKAAAHQDFQVAVERMDYRSARKAIREIRSRIYREEIVAALTNPAQRPQITVSQIAPRIYSPVVFMMQFRDHRLDTADALDAIDCRWDFGHGGLQESGWQVAHFFPAPPGTYEVKATFWQGGQQIADQQGPVVLGQPITTQPLPAEDSPRTQAEVVQLGIALLIALLGLLAGATEQLQKLDFLAAAVAVFLLGFGADSIKNALAPARAEGAAPARRETA